MGECDREHEMREANTGPFEGNNSQVDDIRVPVPEGTSFLARRPIGDLQDETLLHLTGDVISIAR